MKMKKRLASLGALLAPLCAAVPAFADTDTTAAGASPIEPLTLIALVVAILSLLAAGLLFLLLRKGMAQLDSDNKALQRRIKEMEGASARDAGGDRRQSDAARRLSEAEQSLVALERDVSQIKAQMSAPHQTAYAAPRPVVPAQPTFAPAQERPEPVRPAPARAAAASDELTRINRVLNGAEPPERALQKAFSPKELQQMELVHYVHPAMKMQNADYAQFCAYSRINPSNVSLLRMGQNVFPYKLSLNAPAIHDWYEISRETDKENAAPHMVVAAAALVKESGESVCNEAGETQRLLCVARKGRLIAYNL